MKSDPKIRFAVGLRFSPPNDTQPIEVWRYDDDGQGKPADDAGTHLATLPPGSVAYTDMHDTDERRYHYRVRCGGPGLVPGGWSAWIHAQPKRVVL